MSDAWIQTSGHTFSLLKMTKIMRKMTVNMHGIMPNTTEETSLNLEVEIDCSESLTG